MADRENLPKIRAYQLDKVFELQRSIVDGCHNHFTGSVMQGIVLLELARLVWGIACPKADVGVVFDSLRNLAGCTLTPQLIRDMAWRIAGNTHRLIDGIPVHPWSEQKEQEWVPTQVIRLVRTVRQQKLGDNFQPNSGYTATLRVLAGRPAGHNVEAFWSYGVCDMLKVEFGYSRYNRARYSRVVSKRQEYPYQDPREFFGMRVQLLIDPEKCQSDRVGYSEIKGTATTFAWNRLLMARRDREDTPCPFGWGTDQVACYQCIKGQDECSRACHNRTYLEAVCPECHRLAWFDPEDDIKDSTVPVCIDCR